MLTNSDLSVMRDAIEQLLPDTCNILAGTETSDGMGGVTLTWGTAGTAIPCRFDFKSGREFVVGVGLQSFTSAMLSLAYDVTITEVNRVEKIDIDTGSVTHTYAVSAPVNSDQSWRAVKRVQLELV